MKRFLVILIFLTFAASAEVVITEGDYMYTAVSAKADSEGVFYFTQLFYR